jgi:hypothetical protein
MFLGADELRFHVDGQVGFLLFIFLTSVAGCCLLNNCAWWRTAEE